MDQALFRLINGLAGRSPLLDGFMRLLVNDYFVPTLLFLLLVGFWFSGQGEERGKNQRAALRVIVALLVVNALVKVCNLFYFRPRPFSVQEVHLLFYRPSDSSLPSNPAAVAFTFAAVLWRRERAWGALAGLLATLFGLARIFCGVHYPLDIIAGGLIGVLAAYLVARGERFLHPLYNLFIELARRLHLA